ncbi:MAG: hypothetical protein AAF602_04155 [Myxococcota bacterium]
MSAFVLWLAGCAEPMISGPTALEVGTGQFDFETVEEAQRLPMVQGPQGGYHVWVALRARNLDPRRLRVDSQLFAAPETDDTGAPLGGEDPEAVGESFFFFPPFFDDDEDGVWRTAGLPHQVERTEVRGERLRLEVVATDRDGRTAVGEMIIRPVNDAE